MDVVDGYVLVELGGSVFVVETVYVYTSAENRDSYEVSVGLPKDNLIPCEKMENPANANEPLAFECRRPTYAQYLKVADNTNGANRAIVVGEIEIYGISFFGS